MSDPIRYAEDQPPDLQGKHGRAWRRHSADIAQRHPGGPPSELTVADWTVEAPYAHPIWHSYWIACISLRDMPGAPKANILLPGATHEVLVFALNPQERRALNDIPRYLTPGNFCGQWKAGSDVEAARYIEETVQLVIDGRLNPDTDYARWWMHRFSASNIKGDPRRAGETQLIINQGEPDEMRLVFPPKPGPQDMH